MNWKLIFQLSVFGLIMAFGTISLIPEKIEPAFWLVIFMVCSYIIAKTCTGNYFWYGFFVSLVNSIWITAAHVAFYDSYTAHHPDMTTMYTYFPTHPRLMMLIWGPVFGILFGIIQGIFAFIASKIVKRKVAVTNN